MTPQERQILEQAENQAFETAQQLEATQITSGRQPEPEVTTTETNMEYQPFGLDFIEVNNPMPTPSASA